MKIGSNIREQRVKNNLTQKELAEQLSVTAQAVSRWENDEVEPDLTTIDNMCKIFNIEINELLSSQNQETESNESEIADVEESDGGAIICSICLKEIEESEIATRLPKVICKACSERRQSELKEASRIQTEIKEKEADTNKKIRTKSPLGFKVWRFIISGVIAVGILLVGLLCVDLGAMGISVKSKNISAIVVSAMFFMFVWQLMKFDTPVQALVVAGLTKSVQLPGVIFSLDLDSIAFALAYKFIIAPVISFLITLLFAIGACILGLIISPFTFFFYVFRDDD